MANFAGALVPPIYFFSDNKNSIGSNSLYKVTWWLIMLGHLILYALPGLTWPISFAARPGFNFIYVMWQQYMSFWVGGSLSFVFDIMLFVSYFLVVEEKGLTATKVLTEAIAYTLGSLTVFLLMLWRNKEF